MVFRRERYPADNVARGKSNAAASGQGSLFDGDRS